MDTWMVICVTSMNLEIYMRDPNINKESSVFSPNGSYGSFSVANSDAVNQSKLIAIVLLCNNF